LYALGKIKLTLAEKTVSDEYFLRLHFCVEALLKRLFFIGLRLKGVQYKFSQMVAVTYHEGISSYIKTALRLCGIDHAELKRFNNYEVLEDLFINFSSQYRNQRVHGIRDEYTNPELLTALIQTDKGFVSELESFLKKTKRPSLFAPPGKWGAGRAKPKSLAAVYQELSLTQHKERSKYTKEAALKKLASCRGKM
jgi:hypothetical protein